MNYIISLSVTKEAFEWDVFITIEIGREDKNVSSVTLSGGDSYNFKGSSSPFTIALFFC